MRAAPRLLCLFVALLAIGGAPANATAGGSTPPRSTTDAVQGSIPEPASAALFAIGFTALALILRRTRDHVVKKSIDEQSIDDAVADKRPDEPLA